MKMGVIILNKVTGKMRENHTPYKRVKLNENEIQVGIVEHYRGIPSNANFDAFWCPHCNGYHIQISVNTSGQNKINMIKKHIQTGKSFKELGYYYELETIKK